MLKDVEPKLKLIVMMMGSIFTNATTHIGKLLTRKTQEKDEGRANNRSKIIRDDL